MSHPEDEAADLDVSYVGTERILVGSYPSSEHAARALSEHLEGAGNSKCYKVVSCLTEEEENSMGPSFLSPENGFVDAPGCIDHCGIMAGTPGALKQILRVCVTTDTYLAKEERNLVVILCRAGKGRSGMIAACLLLHLGLAMSADAAVSTVYQSRGCTLFPSQIRYVNYYERLLRSPTGEYSQTLRLNAVRFTTIPSFDSSIVNQGCSPVLALGVLGQVAELTALDSSAPFLSHVLFNQKETAGKKKAAFYSKTKGEKEIELDYRDHAIYVRGDTVLAFFSGDMKMLQVCFHTAFVEANYLSLDLETTDCAHRDLAHNIYFDRNFCLELFFSRVRDVPELNIADPLTVIGGGVGGTKGASCSSDMLFANEEHE
jgi:protein-tyrosine phosphatase